MATGNEANEATLDRLYSESPPIDVATAEKMLIEAKHIISDLGIRFFIRQGTCLGIIRDNALIPWDDDVDLGSVIGLHGLTDKTVEKTVDQVAAAFRSNGYFAKIERTDHYIGVALVKWSMRMDWTCYRIIDDSIFHYPGVRIPVRLFQNLKEIDFKGEKFLVPNPPEEYLCFKYGPSWRTPKRSEWVQDVVEMIPESPIPGRAGALKQLFTSQVLRWRAGKLKVLDDMGNAVAGAEVVIAGLGHYRTNKRGYARFYLPQQEWYALVIRHGDHEEVLYEEKMAPGGAYVYRPDPKSTEKRLSVLSRE